MPRHGVTLTLSVDGQEACGGVAFRGREPDLQCDTVRPPLADAVPHCEASNPVVHRR